MPGDFRELFDIRKLDERQMAEIAFVLNSPAYIHSFKPYMQGVLNSLFELWKDRSKKRQDQYNDDFLSGGHAFGEGLLKFFELLLAEVSIEDIHNVLSRQTDEQQYDAANKQPVLGVNQPAMPEKYDPAEDF